MPDGYRGVVVVKKRLEEEGNEGDERRRRGNGFLKSDLDEEGEEEGEEPVAVLEEVGAFEKIVVWDHEKVVEDDDGVVKGVAEWIRFAEAVSLETGQSLTNESTKTDL